MHKRNFLKLLGATLVSAASGALGNAATAATRKRIVVIGAGLAGLAAARELQRRGHDVVVVEARDRIGGGFGRAPSGPTCPSTLAQRGFTAWTAIPSPS